MTDSAPSNPIASLLRPVRGRLMLAAGLQVVSAALVLSPLITCSAIARQLLADPADPDIWRTLLIGSFLLGLGLALRGGADLIAHLADNTLTLILRRRVAARLRTAPLGWFTDTTAGQVKQGMQDDVGALHHLVAHSYTEIAGAVATPIAAYAYLFLIDWRLALILAVPVPVFVLIYRRMMADSGKQMGEYGRVLAGINSGVVEFVDGIPVVKTFGQTGRAHAAYRAAVERFTAFFVGWTRPLIVPETISNQLIAPIALLVLTLLFGTGFVAAEWMDGIDVLPFALVGLGLAGPVGALTSNLQALQMGQAAAARLSALLRIDPIPEPVAPVRPSGTRIELDHVHFGYEPDREVLRDITATFEPGSVTAIVGASGSGKSTLARLLLRYADPTAGQIRLGGVSLGQIASAELFRTVGSVFQDVRLLRASIADNIALARPDATRTDVERAAAAANIHERILRLPRGYDSVYGEDAILSGGEAQRVSIARAFLLDPDVLILDEATSAADAESEHAIQTALSALVTERSRTVIVIAHRLDTIRDADQILVLDQGRIVERGRHDDLLDLGGAYQRLWQAQHHTEGLSR
ncbi:ABC transporter ATP-binding protein [Kibdelosporangium persicum]|uniref:ABC-type multidrug transport system, ATPase and permease component n=1 Tax=Kibdelosporangium persicum TaxID=2698649 RepID=A0ABX2FE42_9PSEU|nr:ABC transporter ATP-binding protein [Kibdelosporangium persicum]NRN69155.1 ABC-type multidrug transport system, ATPase and permease component [Kibdelosporangium persicum]